VGDGVPLRTVLPTGTHGMRGSKPRTRARAAPNMAVTMQTFRHPAMPNQPSESRIFPLFRYRTNGRLTSNISSLAGDLYFFELFVSVGQLAIL